MLKVTAIDHINMNVKNLEETVNFYEKVFGLTFKEKGFGSRGNPYIIIGKKNSLYLCLYEDKNADQATNNVFNHFGVHVDNFEEVKKYLKTNGIPINYGGIVEYDNSSSFYVTDPNGLEIEISKHFGGALD